MRILAIAVVLCIAGAAHAAPTTVSLCSVRGNPYGVRTNVELALTSDLVREALETRDAIDTYLDETPMWEVDIATVRSMIVEVMSVVRCLRPLDVGAVGLGVRLWKWAAAVERELRTEELRRACIEYCTQRADPPCAPEQCFVEDAK